MRVLPAGPDAVLLEFTAPALAAAAQAALTAAQVMGAHDIVLGEVTVLVQGKRGGGIDHLAVRRALRAQTADATPARPTLTVDLPVRYDGADLTVVARALDWTTADVIAAHTESPWLVQFLGFAPGFAYLVPTTTQARTLAAVPRRGSPRPAVPAGAVAVAGGYSAVYPSASPGGWQLLGSCATPLFDPHAAAPALLAAGALVHFHAQ